MVDDILGVVASVGTVVGAVCWAACALMFIVGGIHVYRDSRKVDRG